MKEPQTAVAHAQYCVAFVSVASVISPTPPPPPVPVVPSMISLTPPPPPVPVVALSQAVRDMRTSLLYRGGENPSPLVDNEDERGLSVTYENDVMGRRGQVPGTYYNMPEPKIAGIAPPRSGQSSNSSTLYRFVQNMVRYCAITA